MRAGRPIGEPEGQLGLFAPGGSEQRRRDARRFKAATKVRARKPQPLPLSVFFFFSFTYLPLVFIREYNCEI